MPFESGLLAIKDTFPTIPWDDLLRYLYCRGIATIVLDYIIVDWDDLTCMRSFEISTTFHLRYLQKPLISWTKHNHLHSYMQWIEFERKRGDHTFLLNRWMRLYREDVDLLQSGLIKFERSRPDHDVDLEQQIAALETSKKLLRSNTMVFYWVTLTGGTWS
jgi:hypothetical protein